MRKKPEEPIATWCGKKLEDMTKDQLIRALRHSARLYHACRDTHRLREERVLAEN